MVDRFYLVNENVLDMNAKQILTFITHYGCLPTPKEIRNVSKVYRYLGISRRNYYQWKRAYGQQGEKTLINSKPCPQNLKLRIPQAIEDLILHLRTTYHMGQLRSLLIPHFYKQSMKQKAYSQLTLLRRFVIVHAESTEASCF